MADEGPAPEQNPAEQNPAEPQGPPRTAQGSGLVGPVQIEMLDGLDVIVVRGNQRDVDQVMQIIGQIEKLSTETEPSIEVFPLTNVDGESMATLVNVVYYQVYQLRQGNVTIVPLVKPNALLLIGRQENVKTALELIKKLDQPVTPESQFRVFALKHAPAGAAYITLQTFLANRGYLGTKVRVTADMRSNSLIVQAAPRDIAEVAELHQANRHLDQRDRQRSAGLRPAKLAGRRPGPDPAVRHQRPVHAEPRHDRRHGHARRRGALGGVGAAGGAGGLRPGIDQAMATLRFVTVDARGRRILNSGILSDVHITPDMRANSLLVSAPADSMELIEALIKQLDGRPAAQAQIKVFTIVNGDVQNLTYMLQSLFGTPSNVAQGMTMLQSAAGGGGESSLVPLRFAVDVRTNSIIASGAAADLNVVEAILLRLDESDVRHRKSAVYRLKNSPRTTSPTPSTSSSPASGRCSSSPPD